MKGQRWNDALWRDVQRAGLVQDPRGDLTWQKAKWGQNRKGDGHGVVAERSADGVFQIDRVGSLDTYALPSGFALSYVATGAQVAVFQYELDAKAAAASLPCELPLPGCACLVC